MAKQACFTKEDAIRMAIMEMESCVAYLASGDKRWAAISYGAATVYDEMLYDVFDCNLADENEHYAAMFDIFDDAFKNWDAK